VNVASNGDVVFNHIDEVASVPVSSLTVANDQGSSFPLISKSVNGAPDLLVSLLRMQPGEFHPPHAHPNMGELYFVVEGAAEITVGGETRWCTAGMAIYTPAGVAHSIRTTTEPVGVMVAFPEGDWERIEKVFVDGSP
jgi:mannose-6-phosphate isomerase-like protein (cupin superfamily)